jgi:hypothetical protein
MGTSAFEIFQIFSPSMSISIYHKKYIGFIERYSLLYFNNIFKIQIIFFIIKNSEMMITRNVKLNNNYFFIIITWLQVSKLILIIKIYLITRNVQFNNINFDT